MENYEETINIMKIEIDIEKVIGKNVVDNLVGRDIIQKEVENILKSSEYKKIIIDHIKIRISDMFSSEEGRKLIDNSIVEIIAKSSSVRCDIEDVVGNRENTKLLKEQISGCINNFLSSEEGKNFILNRVKDFLEKYDIDCDDSLTDELNERITNFLVIAMRDLFKKFEMDQIK